MRDESRGRVAGARERGGRRERETERDFRFWLCSRPRERARTVDFGLSVASVPRAGGQVAVRCAHVLSTLRGQGRALGLYLGRGVDASRYVNMSILLHDCGGTWCEGRECGEGAGISGKLAEFRREARNVYKVEGRELRVQGDGQKRETLQRRQNDSGRKMGRGRLEQMAAKRAKGKGTGRKIEDRKMGAWKAGTEGREASEGKGADRKIADREMGAGILELRNCKIRAREY